MYILAIETTGPFGSAALLDLESGEIVASETAVNDQSHLSDLIPMVDRVLKKAKVSKEQIKYIAPSMGPGSFTGIRIGVATARALAQSLGLKGIPIATLDSFLMKPLPKDASAYAVKCAILNARRGQVYGMVQSYMEGAACMLDDVLEVLIEEAVPEGAEIVFYGDGIDAYQEKIESVLKQAGARYIFAEKDIRYQDAESVAKLAYLKAQNGFFFDVNDLVPDYMREAEAETKLRAGALPICKGPKQE